MHAKTLGWAALVAFTMLGCSSGFESSAMKVRYHPPRGVKLLDEQAGPPRVAHFTSGLEIRSVEAAPPAIQEDKLEQLLPVISPGLAGDIISARPGTLSAGKVVRWTLKGDGHRTLVYFVPRPARYLVITMTAPEGRYADQENQLELSLASLKLLD